MHIRNILDECSKPYCPHKEIDLNISHRAKFTGYFISKINCIYFSLAAFSCIETEDTKIAGDFAGFLCWRKL